MPPETHATDIALLRQSIEHLTEKVDALGNDSKAVSQLAQALNIQGERINHLSSRQTEHEKSFRNFVETQNNLLNELTNFVRAETRRVEDHNRESMRRLHERVNGTETRVDVVESNIDKAKGGLFVSQVVFGALYALVLTLALTGASLLFNLKDITTRHEEQLRTIDGRFNTFHQPQRREVVVTQ